MKRWEAPTGGKLLGPAECLHSSASPGATVGRGDRSHRCSSGFRLLLSVPLRLVFIYSSQFQSSQTSARQPEFGWGHGLARVTLKSILDISMIHFRAIGMGGFSAEPSNFWVAVSS